MEGGKNAGAAGEGQERKGDERECERGPRGPLERARVAREPEPEVSRAPILHEAPPAERDRQEGDEGATQPRCTGGEVAGGELGHRHREGEPGQEHDESAERGHQHAERPGDVGEREGAGAHQEGGDRAEEIAATVGIDDYRAGYDIGRHLVANGHSCFGFIKGLAGHVSAEGRYDGFLAALNDAGLSEADVEWRRGNFTFRSGLDCAQALLAAGRKVSAIVCANDDMAAGALLAAHKAGLRVSELSAERIVEKAIVRANWRKNRPVIPVMKTHGGNTEASTSPMAMTGAETSDMA